MYPKQKKVRLEKEGKCVILNPSLPVRTKQRPRPKRVIFEKCIPILAKRTKKTDAAINFSNLLKSENQLKIKYFEMSQLFINLMKEIITNIQKIKVHSTVNILIMRIMVIHIKI